MADKVRLDILLVEKGLATGRDRAKALIMAGKVLVAGQKTDKAGTLVPVNADIRLLGENLPYVSRGGLKLAKAVTEFKLDLQGKIAADIGASTGGFTDCMLQNGAAKVYAVDVGYGQLAWKLRTDSRVVNLERTNVRYVTRVEVPEELEFASVDVAFISLSKVLPAVAALLSDDGEIVALIKPQFEAGREKVGKHGVVKDANVHREVIAAVVNFVPTLNLYANGLTYSPVKGPEGNIEYLAHFTPIAPGSVTAAVIDEVVAAAHSELSESKELK